jgi:hypothetical protein
MALARGHTATTDVVTLALDARKPVTTFAKLLAKRHGDEANVRQARKRAHEELYAIPMTATPYGNITEESNVGSFKWLHLNIFAWFYYIVAESKGFFDLVKAAVDHAPGGCLSLSLYTDEVVPRNKLRPDAGGKYQAVYFQIMDFPDWIRHRFPLRWFTFGYASARELEDAGVGVGQLMRCVLRSWFGDFWNLAKTGIRLKHGDEVVHMFARFACCPQDERAHKFGFDVKGSSGRNPCASCQNCIGRVPFFEDDSGFVHVWSPCYEKFIPKNSAAATEMLDALEHVAKHGSAKEREDLEMASGYVYDESGLLWDQALRPYISFPDCIYWDWMHNWCSSGGIAQFFLNAFVLEVTSTLGMSLSQLDEFAAKVSLPKSSPRLTKRFFHERIIQKANKHIRAFAAEVLVAVQVLAMFCQLVLKPVGVLTRHIEGLEALQELFALFKKGHRQDIPRARALTRKHHEIFLELLDDKCARPKLHYCMHVIDCWERFGVLLSCFGAESNHRFSTDVFAFAYNKACTTALAFDIRRLTQAALDANTFTPTYLAGSVAKWAGEDLTDMGPWGFAKLVGSSTELVAPRGRFYKNDLVEWVAGNLQKLGRIQCSIEVDANGLRKFAVIVDELQHVRAGLWTCIHVSIVDSSMLRGTHPFVEEDGLFRPLYVGV